MIVATLFFLTGLAGTVLPLLPGTPLIFVGMLVYGYMTGFVTLDLNFFLLQGLAMSLTFVTDYAVTALGTNRYGGSRAAVAGTIIGSVFGVVTLGPVGIILGCFLGAMVGELLSGKQPGQAIRAGIGALVGFVGAVAIKLMIALVMIAWFIVRVAYGMPYVVWVC